MFFDRLLLLLTHYKIFNKKGS